MKHLLTMRLLLSIVLVAFATIGVMGQTEVQVINQTNKNALDSNQVKWQAALIKDSICKLKKTKWLM